MTRFPERQIAAWTVAILFCLFPFYLVGMMIWRLVQWWMG